MSRESNKRQLKGAAMGNPILAKRMTEAEYGAELARLEARHDAAGDDLHLLHEIAKDMIALCDAATISEIPGLGIPKAKKPKRLS
jgi:hypothetical protein